jgi:hypothetical protein
MAHNNNNNNKNNNIPRAAGQLCKSRMKSVGLVASITGLNDLAVRLLIGFNNDNLGSQGSEYEDDSFLEYSAV